MLMNTEMVKAILARRKTVTRRLIKPQPKDKLEFIVAGDTKHIGKWFDRKNGGYWIPPCCCGDVLYVRETWCKGSLNGGAEQYFYKADDNDFHCQWRPSIHMPKEAARIFLRVTDVRVERLQDIRLEGCLAEGVQLTFLEERDFAKRGLIAWQRYSTVWDSTIKKSDLGKCGWDANPWVWVIEFERISKEEALKNA